MEVLTATFRIVTPMFIGGADQSPSDGIRPPSVKGALRFWWRALNWGKFITNPVNNNEQGALQALQKAEAQLFGSAVKDKKGGQGCFLLSVVTGDLTTTPKNRIHREFSTNDGSRYMAFGLMAAFGANSGNLTRGCINENQYFKVKLVFKKAIDSEIEEALLALGLLGGLGSRNRHGLGSICLESIAKDNKDIWKKANDSEEYSEQIKNLLNNKLAAASPSPFSSFDKKTRVEILLQASSGISTLSKVGEALMMYRSAGFSLRGGDHLVLGKPTEKNFKEDHDWKHRYTHNFTRWADGELPNDFHPKRAVFGLPHNYGGDNNSVAPENSNRRTSPLFVHIHQVNENSFIAVSLFLPTLFLPDGERISAGGDMVPNNIDYSVITDFLDGKGGGEGRTVNPPRFPDRTEICKGSEA